MNVALSRDAMSETYMDLAGMIHDLVNRFCRRYQMEWDEALSRAHVAFVEACECYDSKKANITTHVYTRVCGTLLEWQRKTMRAKILGPVVDYDTHLLPDDGQKQCYLMDLMDELSDDARTLVKLVIHRDRDVVEILDRRSGKATPHKLRSVIREVCLDLGWTTERIAESFDEVRQALA